MESKMKKTLLLLTACLLAHTGSQAQGWQPPKPKPMEFTIGEECYMYNLGTGKFYTEGHSYGTQGSIDNEGLKCRFGVYNGNGAANGTCSLSNYSIVKGQWMTAYVTTNGALYVDGGSSTPNIYWTVEPKGDLVYQIKVTAPNPVYNQENYPGALLGVDQFEDTTRTVLACLLMEAEEPGDNIYQTDWIFTSAEGYEQFQHATATYKAALSLKDLLDEATEKGRDVTEEQAVYDNTESTLEELTAAINSVTAKILGEDIGEASPDNPVNVTQYFITNPGYDINTNEGWQGSTPSFNAARDLQIAEFFNLNYDYYQDLVNLPEGYYKVNIQGFYRAGLPAEAMTHKQEGEENFMYAEIYATTSEGTVSDNLQSIFNGATGEALGTTGEILNGSYYTPDDMVSAAAYFAAGRYADNPVMVHVTDGKLRIGIRKGTTLRRDWTIFDNWSLTYYGKENPIHKEQKRLRQ